MNYVGKRLDGRYIIKEIIGVGGMAVVYKAYDSQDDRVVAVKILKDEYLTNEDFRRRFKNESKAIAVLSHPNIVKVYDVSYGDRLQYIVMEYVEGITLKEYISQQGSIGWKETLYFITQILRALQHAHDKGIVHRDIKPQNIMLLENGTIKVTDFGIARLSNSETRTMSGSAVGSVHYISPEQARGDITDNKSDIYSVGVVLYEMLTGKLPFESDTTVAVALMQLQNDAVSPREINPSIPVGIEQIIMRAMQKNARQRYQSASEMLSDIDAFKRNPSIRFNYSTTSAPVAGGTEYFVDDQPTKYATAPRQPAPPVQRRPAPPSQPPQQRRPAPQQQRPQPQPRKRIEEDDYEEEETNHTLPVIGGIIGGLLVLAAIIIGACLMTGVFAQKVTVPNFIGMNYALEILDNPEYADFVIELNDSVESDTYEEGVVYDQSPSPRVKIRPDEKITVFVPKMRTDLQVPDVYGVDFAEAITIIESADFKYTLKYEDNSEIESEKVIRTTPERFATAPAGTTVIIYISSENDTAEIPGIVGWDTDTARELLASVGLEMQIAEEVNSTEEEGTVVKLINYNEKTEVPKGTIIQVAVSNGKAPESTAEISFRLPDTGESETGVIKVFLANELVDSCSNKTLLLNGATHTFEVTSSDEEKKLVVRINDCTVYECRIDFTQDPAVISDEQIYEYSGSSSSSTPSGKGSLPNVEGLTYDEAYDRLVSAGFTKVTKNDVFTDNPLLDGLVFQQTPPYKALTRYPYSTSVVLSVYIYQSEE
ncbi:MAG: Stk1 family PASTA domain-containing Ser/Thr kinase [Clostridia bacterium]|nr:Stk1 family PASTA domain-containing Ser/Thr kinase [Clostridia bacterium]